MKLGQHMTDEQRARCSAAHMGKFVSSETRAKHSAHMGQFVSSESRAKMSAAQMGRVTSPETRAKQSAAAVGRIVSPETRMKIGAAAIGRKASPETRAKMSVALMGRIMSPEMRAKESAASMGRIMSPETRAKLSRANWQCGRKESNDRKHAKRRALGFLPMNQYFPGSDGHHLDIDHVVFIPSTLHQSVSHDHGTGRGMEQINALALAYAGLAADVLDDTLPFD